ncbi:hypothetical protein [Colwellia sp. E2M01]|uniref:hypothetical protein n=1 Tax=Colwellia sp. E2M01 TaxID=2841561 RepID=UPI001C087962|nr:hypothetical protein [Colwellia sp. E2M01]MBU2870044.1 hypothetical protein [Colwellia sp. E2M01]
MPPLKKNIRDEPTITSLLEKMPSNVADSFNEEQLSHLLTILGSRNWGKHSIDFRGTFKVPFYKWRFYYVFLIGKNSRNLTRKEKSLSLLRQSIFLSIIICIIGLVGALIIYLVKSSLGIDILPNFSFGVWDWFKENF